MKPVPLPRSLALAGALLTCLASQAHAQGLTDATGATAPGPRQVTILREGWRFVRGSPARAADPDLDDSSWAVVRVPHDFAIGGPVAPAGGDNSRLLWQGEGWYRYHFRLAPGERGKRVYLDFDGAMAFPEVHVNGVLAGQWDYGYNAFRVDATDLVRFGGENVLAVHVDTRLHGSRWYPGAGLYRKVTLTLTAPIHVGLWGTYVTTPVVEQDRAVVRVETTVENHLAEAQDVHVTTYVYGPGGDAAPEVAQETALAVPAGGGRTVAHELAVVQPRRWDIDAPNLYRAVTVLARAGVVTDVYETSFGIRTVEFTVDDGFHLNGRRVPIQGVCLHHDQGPLGAAFHRRALERQLEILKGMGANAIRTSHNPPAPELFELADRMGMLVLAEAFDKWDGTADRLPWVDLATFGERQLSAYLRRERNHPSIIAWSIGNEITDVQLDSAGADLVGMMAALARSFDPTRAVTMASNLPSSIDTGLHGHLDVDGWNYGRKYVPARRAYPHLPQLVTESASGVSSRGYYQFTPPVRKDAWPAAPELDAFDYYAVPWGDIADVEFAGLDEYPYVAGEFVWSGFDYIGEPTPFEGTSRVSYFGIVDLVGLPKDRYYLYRSRWARETPTVHVLPHWTWPELSAGAPVPVSVYTSGDSAELFLNGRSLGRRWKAGLPPPLTASLAILPGAKASSQELARSNLAGSADDGQPDTRWCAADGSVPQSWQVDLGLPLDIRTVRVLFERDIASYQYVISGSLDGVTWTPLVTKADFSGVGPEAVHAISGVMRFLKIDITALQDGAWASIAEFAVYDVAVPGPGEVVDRYRIRWPGVPYAPGELRAVAYANGQVIGEDVVRTAGAPATLALAADREVISADGDDLSYITIAASDAIGVENPRADATVLLTVTGPGDLVGVGNGDQRSLAPFTGREVKLYDGKAVAIVRARAGTAGEIHITAEAEGLAPATVVLRSAP